MTVLDSGVLRVQTVGVNKARTAVASAKTTTRPGRMSVVSAIIARELRESLRNRWLISFAVCFALLSASLALLTRSAAGDQGAAGFGRTAAGLINLVMVLVPLMSMTAAASSVAGDRERGVMAFLLAQPVSLFEVMLGKFIGLSMSVVAAVVLGFGVGALLIAASGGGDAWTYAQVTMLTALLAIAMVSVGMLVSAFCRRSGTAITAVLLTWLALVFACDLVLMGSHVALKLGVPTLFHLSLVNPLQVFKVAALTPLGGSLDVLGPAAAWAVHVYGVWLLPTLLTVLVGWAIAPATVAFMILRRKGAA